jgi:hypothetical protein
MSDLSSEEEINGYQGSHNNHMEDEEDEEYITPQEVCIFNFTINTRFLLCLFLLVTQEN